jgi:chromosome segregation ATPase
MWPFSRRLTLVVALADSTHDAVVAALAHLDDHTDDLDRYADPRPDPEEGLDMEDEDVTLKISELSEKQLLVLIARQQRQIIAGNQRMEARMSDLTAAVDDLKGAVDGVAQRLLPQIQALESSLDEAQTQLSAALADDEQAAQVFADAQAAAAAIRTEVGRLNALGAEPETPVDVDPTDPVDPPPVDVEPDPNAPHPDQSLPGDQPYVDPRGKKR